MFHFVSCHQERPRNEEEEERLRREAAEEWWKTAQKKRKSLRDRWLSETAPAPAHPSVDCFRHRPLLQDTAKHEGTKERIQEKTENQKTPEDEDTADARKEEAVSQEENKESVNCRATVGTHDQASTEEDVEAEGHISIQMTERMFHDSRQDGRSVLGMVSVQVKRDSKTGATIIRSVSPMSTPTHAAMATTIFDDGRKSIHAVGGASDQPSAEELGQILSVIDGVGLKVLLDEVTVTPNKEDIENLGDTESPEGKALSYSSHHVKENHIHLDSSGSRCLEAEPGIEGCPGSVGEKEDEKEERNIMVMRDTPGKLDNIANQRMEEGPITLTFLGYGDAATGYSQGVCEDQQETLTVEHVIISEEGEEEFLELEVSTSPQSTSADRDLGQEAGKELQEVFQDIALDANRAKFQAPEQEGDAALHNSSPPSTAEGEVSSNRKTCQCCSVM
ncbi:hypothetical protein LDENG_00123300 [Lucifuga dentata]|nr:hypothetical protein LDENG_00123300 [Lucifuga dentata]